MAILSIEPQKSEETKNPLCCAAPRLFPKSAIGFIKDFMKHALALLFLIILSACTVLQVEKIPLGNPLPIPPEAQPSPIGFREIRYAIPTGTTTMGISARSTRCPMMMRKVNRGWSGRSFITDSYKRILRDTMQGLGYDIAGDPNRIFDEEEDSMRSHYLIGARVLDLKMDVCTEKSFLFGYDIGVVGEAMMEVEWSVYDSLRRRNAYKTRTKGYARLDGPNDEGVELLLEDSFAAAAHNLATDPEFFDLIFKGIAPTIKPDTVEDPDENPLPLFDAQEIVKLAPVPPGTTAATPDDIKRLTRAAVLIQVAGAHGSGFFLTRDGHILTNAHVVGYATRVRIVTSGKKEALFAQVLRVDPVRDVALLRLEETPEKLTITTLPVRLEKPAVSEETYAIGAPARTKLQDSVTKGIISAHRYDSRRKIWLMQSDTYIGPGSSGGPFLDTNGNLIGISVAGYVSAEGGSGDLNLFIPIKDALDALKIEASHTAPLPLVILSDSEESPILNNAQDTGL